MADLASLGERVAPLESGLGAQVDRGRGQVAQALEDRRGALVVGDAVGPLRKQRVGERELRGQHVGMLAVVVVQVLVQLPGGAEIVQLAHEVPLLESGIENEAVPRIIVHELLEQLVGVLQLPVQALPLQQHRRLVKRHRGVLALLVFRGVDEVDQHALRPDQVAALREMSRLDEVGIFRRRLLVKIRAEPCRAPQILRCRGRAPATPGP